MDISLKLNQETKLILTHEMKLSLNLLQMSVTDLMEYLEKEEAMNPAFEIDFSTTRERAKKSDSTTSLMDNIQPQETFLNHLEEQLHMIQMSKDVHDICIYILNNLDNRGFLTMETKDIIKNLKTDPDTFKKAIDIVHSLDPIGSGAHDLQECLKIQLMKKNIFDKNIYILIDDLLNELGEKKYDLIARKLGVSQESVLDYLSIIKSLNPIPARGFLVENNNNYIIPLCTIKKTDKNELSAIFNEESFPKIKLDKNYTDNDPVAKDNIHRALMIIKAIEKRYDTIRKIIQVIMEKQKNYFLYGPSHISNLTLEDVANKIDMHISTVSRAVKEKYICTTFGTIPLKRLFKANADSLVIKDMIEKLISSEDKSSPLSDNEMAFRISRSSDHKVARRTIAKYRSELGIDSAVIRKKR